MGHYDLSGMSSDLLRGYRNTLLEDKRVLGLMKESEYTNEQIRKINTAVGEIDDTLANREKIDERTPGRHSNIGGKMNNNVTLDRNTYEQLLHEASIAESLSKVQPVTNHEEMAAAMLAWKLIETAADGLRMEIEKFVMSQEAKDRKTVVIAGIRARYNAPRVTYFHKDAVLANAKSISKLRAALKKATTSENLDPKVYTALSKEFDLEPESETAARGSVTLSLEDK